MGRAASAQQRAGVIGQRRTWRRQVCAAGWADGARFAGWGGRGWEGGGGGVGGEGAVRGEGRGVGAGVPRATAQWPAPQPNGLRPPHALRPSQCPAPNIPHSVPRREVPRTQCPAPRAPRPMPRVYNASNLMLRVHKRPRQGGVKEGGGGAVAHAHVFPGGACGGRVLRRCGRL